MTVEVVAVAGETSGDRILAGVAGALAPRGVRLFGLGGTAARAAGVEIVADLASFSGMGTTEVIGRLPAVGWALARLVMATRRRRPRAAVLVDYTEVNLRLGSWLRARQIPVLWCVAPQVWAWRPTRIGRVARSLDRLAVLLPFEEALWRRHGVDAHYVGHPALAVETRGRAAARQHLGIPADVPAVALLPGSRPHEIGAHLATMLAAFAKVRQKQPRATARLLHAPSAGKLGSAAGMAARDAGAEIVEVDPVAGALPHLAAFDAAIVTSGTATLECALAGASPVIVYRAAWLTALIARANLTTPWIGLPNVILGRGEFPELLQERFTPEGVADAVATALALPEPARRARAELRERLTHPADKIADRTAPGTERRGGTAGTGGAGGAGGADGADGADGAAGVAGTGGATTVGDRSTSRIAAMLDPWLDT